MSDYVIPSVENLQLSSPLDTLLRRTSSRRRPQVSPSPTPVDHRRASDASESQYILIPTMPDASPKLPKSFLHPPPSPLLHTRFRASIATQSSLNTYADLSGHFDLHAASGNRDGDDDDASIYSTATTSLANYGHISTTFSVKQFAEQRGGAGNPVQSSPSSHSNVGTSTVIYGHRGIREENRAMDLYSYGRRSPSQTPVPVPTVVVSAEEEPEDILDGHDGGLGNASASLAPNPHLLVGRTPSSLPKNLNFSRPVKSGGGTSGEDEAKRQVLARNAFRSRQSAQPSSPHLSGKPPLFEERQRPSPKSPGSPSDSPLAPTFSPVPSARHASNLRVSTNNHLEPLLHEPPPLPSSSNSIYSIYSYYQLDSPTRSPTMDTLQVPPSPHAPPPINPPPLASPASKNDPQQPALADQLLQQGIQHHEANRLREAAIAFERSATTPGGSGVGMLMWGLTLRHGWGCPKNESLGFSWLRRAAEAAVGDLERARAGVDTNAVRGELVLAIYEVGQCFLQGWGVKKDHKMAVVSCLFGLCFRT
jgi:hypothetical protein